LFIDAAEKRVAMAELDYLPHDYATPLDGEVIEEEGPGVQIVRWYERPGWPLSSVPPWVALASALALGVIIGGAATWGVIWAKERFF
jgi:hypothetical protein